MHGRYDPNDFNICSNNQVNDPGIYSQTGPFNFTIANIPAGATFIAAFIIFDEMNINPLYIHPTITFNSYAVAATPIGSANFGGNPFNCWENYLGSNPPNYDDPGPGSNTNKSIFNLYHDKYSFYASIPASDLNAGLNGSYSIGGLPLYNNSNSPNDNTNYADADGATLIVIYQEPNCPNYMGSLTITGGMISIAHAGSWSTFTLNGIPTLPPTVITQNAFFIASDIEDCSGSDLWNIGVLPANKPFAPPYPYAQIWNTISQNTSLPANSNNCNYYIDNNGSDCYEFVADGFYYQYKPSVCIPYVSINLYNPSICYGSSIALTASGASFYTWAPLNSGLSCYNCANPIATPTVTTTYTVTGTSVNGCSNTATVTIFVYPPLSVTASITPPLLGFCVGTPFNLTATATGGTGPYTYKWIWPPSNSYSGQNFSTFMLPNTTIYTVTVTDANRCITSTTISVNGNSNCCYLSCPNPLDIRSGANSSSYGNGISSNNCVTISGPGIFTINNNFTISASTIAMGSGATIDVQAPYTLTITGSTLYACGDMWQGIKVEAGAILIIDNSTIEDAQICVDVVNPNTTVSITSSTLNNNYYDIEFSRSPLANPAAFNFTLRNTTLTCKADAYSPNNYLKPPYAPGVITNSGVYINNIGVGFPVTVGDYTGSYLNTFNNMNYGVNAVNSSFNVYNNKFENLLGYTYQIPCTNSSGCPPPIGIAVLATASHWYEGSDPTNYGAYYLATVGGSIGNQNNTMQDCYRGVDITEYAYPAVENNNMLNTTNLPPLPPSLSVSPYGDHGIYLKEPINPEVTSNSIQNFATGIHLYGFPTNSTENYPSISGNGNVSSNNISANSNGVLYSGIIAEDGIGAIVTCYPIPPPCQYTSYPLAIELNSIIDASYSCITLNNISCGSLYPAFVKVNNNTALQLAPAPANYTAYRMGILVDNCSADVLLNQSFTISNNSIYSPGSVINSNTNNATNTHVIGIRGILSYGIIYKCNDIGNVGQCIRFDGDNCPSSIYRNHMTSCYDGFVLWNNGMIGQQGRPINMPISLGLPIGDKWVGTPIINYFYHSETWTENSDATQSPLYVLNNPQQNPSLNSGNPPSTPYCYSSCTALDPQSIFTTSGEPPLCPPTICYTCQAIDASVKGEMHRAVHDSIPFFVFMPQSSYLSKQTVLSAIMQDTALMSGDTVLQKFYNASQTNNMGIISSIAQQIQQGNISNALSLNNALNPTNIVEANHKAVYDVELHTLAVHIDTIDSLQYATLYNIASQCPLEGGRAVFHARAFLNRLLNTSLIWNDSCNSDSVFNHRPKKLASTEETENPNPEFKLYPNPNSDNMILEYNISTSDNTKIVIFDMLGQEIYNSILPPNQNILNIHTNLPNGVYMYSIISTDSGILKTGKVVIIK